MPVHRHNRLSVSVGTLLGCLLAAGCGGTGTDTAKPHDKPRSSKPAVVYTFDSQVAWADVAGQPDPERLEAIRTEAVDHVDEGGETQFLDSCPLGTPELVLAGLPPVWSQRTQLRATVDAFNSFGDEPGLDCTDQGRSRVEFAVLPFAPDMDDPADRTKLLRALFPTPPGNLSEPGAIFGGSGFTHCYENTTTAKPACQVVWVHQDLAVSGTIFGDGATAQVAADWFTTALPLMIGDSTARDGAPDGSDAQGETYEIRFEDDQGFKLTADLLVRPAIAGSDSAQLAEEWALVGGEEGDMPCLDADVRNDMTTGTAIHTQTSAYAFGTLSIRSETPGFDAPDHTWQFATGRAEPTDGEWVGSMGGPKAMGVGFSDGSRCDGLDSGGFLLSPDMTDDEWGPVPVVFAYDGVFTPNHPDGDESVVDPYPVSVSSLLGRSSIVDGSGEEVAGIPIRLSR